MKRSLCAALFSVSLLTLAGCDQIENSGKQVLGAATDSAKKAIDQAVTDTHKAATQALDDAKQQLSTLERDKEREQQDKADKSGQEI